MSAASLGARMICTLGKYTPCRLHQPWSLGVVSLTYQHKRTVSNRLGNRVEVLQLTGQKTKPRPANFISDFGKADPVFSAVPHAENPRAVVLAETPSSRE